MSMQLLRIYKLFLTVIVVLSIFLQISIILKESDFSSDNIVGPTYATSETSQDTRADFTPWGIYEFSPIDLDQPDKTTIYAGYRPYTFRFSIDDPTNFQYVTQIKLTAVFEGKEYLWERYWRSYNRNMDRQKVQNDPNDPVSRSNYTTGYYSPAPGLNYLDFNITFSWLDMSRRGPHTWKVDITENNTDTTTIPVTIKYDHISSVRFIGNLKVEGAIQGVLKKNDWVKTNENITWSGLKVVYDSSLNLVPPESQAQIIIYDNDNDNWLDTSNYGEEMRIYTKADSVNDPSNKHTIEVLGPAQYHLNSQVSFTLRVDGDEIHFHSPSPKATTWITQTIVNVEIAVTDNSSSGVDLESIEFQFSTNNGKAWSGWYKPEITADNAGYKCSDKIEFVEGSRNIVQWRGKDLVGNGITYSKYYRINIDGSPAVFKNPVPTPGELQYSEEILCSISITDSISGINATSIQYSIKLDGRVNWTSWRNLGYSFDNRTVIASKKIKFQFGEFNFIRWRVKDIAGNGFFESKPYQLNITHKIPKVKLISPASGTLLNVTRPTFKWNNSYLLVQPVSYSIYYWLESDPINRTEVIVEDTEYTTKKTLLFGETYNWEVIPETIDEVGICVSGVWNFTIDTLANIQPWFELEAVVTSGDGIKINREETKRIEILIYNKGNQYDNYHFELIADSSWNDTVDYIEYVMVAENSTKTVFINISAPSELDFGTYSLRLKISSTRTLMINKSLNKILSIDVKIVEKTGEPISVEVIQWLTIAIVIIVIILIVIYVLISRAKYKKFEDELMHGSHGPQIAQKPRKDQEKKVKVAKAEVEFTPEHKKVVDSTSKEIKEPTDKSR